MAPRWYFVLASENTLTMRHFYNTLFVLLILGFGLGSAQAQSCTPQGNQTSYGNNNTWRGYVYQGMNFNTYKGYVTEGNSSSPNFDESFGGDQVNYSTNGCSIYTDTFSVRYKLTKNFANGTYDFTVGGDDGYRLSVDGGSTWIIDQWADHSYQTTTVSVALNGNTNLVLEFYERFGGNRVSFSYATACIGNGNPATYGSSDNWIGYLYQGMNFNTYKGYITRGGSNSGNFDENFGSANGTFNTSNCSIRTEQFSARFRLTKNFAAGNYIITVGGDDGYRLSLDGGATWVINRWNDQSYSVTTVTVALTGTRNLVLEYYENGGDNRVSFSMTTSALPVTISKWNAQLGNNNSTTLSWTADGAVNFDHFIVQRSSNAVDYTNLQSIQAVNNNNYTNAYQYVDRSVPAGKSYYRLAMVDKDGSVRYSSVLVISAKGTESFQLYPTVVENKTLMVQTSQSLKNAKLELISLNGQVNQTQYLTGGSGTQQVKLNGNISTGAYVVRITDANGFLATQKIFVK